MALPLTPKTTQIQRFGTWINPIFGNSYTFVVYTLLRTGVNQQKPYNIDTGLTTYVARTLKGASEANSWAVTPGEQDDTVEATNAARAKFVSKLGDSSQLGATLTAEARSSWGTVSGGITNALLAANAVRRGRLTEAGEILGFSPPSRQRIRTIRVRNSKGRYVKRTTRTSVWIMPDGKHVAQSLGNKWLWYSYGVKPLIEDIYNAHNVLVRNVPEMRIFGSGSGSLTIDVGGFYRTRYIFTSSVRISAVVRVNNPNLWLANQLGLINPVQWFVEGVRLSFVIDWFSNFSQIVNQMTDFAGLEITRPITTSKCKVVQDEFHPDYGPWVKEREKFTRELIVPQARLRFAYERFNWQRGLNAISLLVQGLKSSTR